MIYHIAERQYWEEARRSGHYVRSTAGRSLEDEGFIHCAEAHQVPGVAAAFFAGYADLVLLVIDPTRLIAELRNEQAPGTTDVFPHIYGPLNVDAVVEVQPFTP
ncbi:MAG: DUF952 domain-containing protein [Acidimicrobiales bacterium]